jgi:hypothetical protein
MFVTAKGNVMIVEWSARAPIAHVVVRTCVDSEKQCRSVFRKKEHCFMILIVDLNLVHFSSSNIYVFLEI